MSATVTDVLDRTAYQAPEADLVQRGVCAEDRLFSAEGRIGVMRYNARIFQATAVVALSLGSAFLAQSALSTVIPSIILTVGVLTGIPAFAMVVYSAIKRLHDLDKSGYFYLLGLIPIVGSIFTLYYSYKPANQEDNRFGAYREATQSDKIMGVIGIVLTALLTIGALIPKG